MANEEHLMILKQGVDVWNAWRLANFAVRVDLVGADLQGFNLAKINLSGANLTKIDLSGANLARAELNWTNLSKSFLHDANFTGAMLRKSNLSCANLHGANLSWSYLAWGKLSAADLTRANLSHACLSQTDLSGANFSGAKLDMTDLSWASFGESLLGNIDLTKVQGLESCKHFGPSFVDHRTVEQSSNVPLNFWRGCGLPDMLIEYMPSLTGYAIQFYSCFISYSSKDQEFADRLHADLQNAGVRCWFARHDLPIGAKTWDGIDEAIRTRDKVLLILSRGAIASDWVEDEVTKAFAEERRRKELVLFPVRLDDAVMDSDEPWAGKLRDNRNIGDFSKWKEHDAYKSTFERVLRDLRAMP